MAEPMLCAIMEQEDMVLSNRQMRRKIAPTSKKPFLWRIINAPACCAFSLTVLAALPVFFAGLAVFPARLAAAYSFLMACFCCQRENGLLVSWGFSRRDF